MMRSWPRFSLFWKLQLAGWSAYVASTFSAKLLVCGGVFAALGAVLLRDGGGFALTLVMREIYRWLYRYHRSPKWIFCSVLLLSFLGALLQLPLYFGLENIFPCEERTIFGAYAPLGLVLLRGGQLLGWSALYFWIKTWLDKKADERRLEQEEAKRSDAELLMLRSLINSHFLFNSLNTVLIILDRKQQGARDMVQSLSDYLKYSLKHRKDNLVPLGEEVIALDDYLALEKVRLAQMLDFSQTVEDHLHGVKVPGFILQPLIENAIKYGREANPDKVLVRLLILREGDDLLIQVRNTGRWIQSDPSRESGGVGLEVIQRKLTWMYPNRHRLTTRDEGGWVTVEIRTPIIL